jgi:hypothetical protein
VLHGRDARLLPYSQLNDGKREGGPRLRPGDGEAHVDALLNALPPDVPLSLEWPPPAGSELSAAAWAKFAFDGAQRFLSEYRAQRT